MKKYLITILYLFIVYTVEAQETVIVNGFLSPPSVRTSQNFQKYLFSYFKGDFITVEYNRLSTFRVDTVIGGTLFNFNNEINKAPFEINICIMNECTLLEYNKKYTLRIKSIPNTRIYYIDSLNQVSPNVTYLDKLEEYFANYLQNVNRLNTGSMQEKYDFIDNIQKYTYTSKYTDYRYISYLLPFVSNNDTIINESYLCWDGFDKRGKMIGGTDTIKEKGLFSDFSYTYFSNLLPFAIPPKTTDSIGWHQWYDSLFVSNNFQELVYCPSEHKYITGGDWIAYFLLDKFSDKVYFRTSNNGYILDLNTDSLEKMTNPKNLQLLSIFSNFSIQNNEIPLYNSYLRGINLYKFGNGFFIKQENELIPLNLIYKETGSSYFISPHLIVHNDKNFSVFSSQNSDGYNCLSAVVIDRKGKMVMTPKKLYQKQIQSYIGDTDEIGSFSFCHSSDSNIVFSFTDNSYGRKTHSAKEKHSKAVIIYELNKNLEKKDSSIHALPFPSFDFRFYQTHILRNGETYLLLTEILYNEGGQLFYKLLNKDLTPKTDFVKLANDWNHYKVSKPIITSEGFMFTWVGNDLSENVLRSVLIDTLGNQSKIINISNYQIDDTYNIEIERDYIDFYLLNKAEKSLIRKRVNKIKYGL